MLIISYFFLAHRWPVLYFRVKQVNGFSEEESILESYLADTDHTSLYMVSMNFTTLDHNLKVDSFPYLLLLSYIGNGHRLILNVSSVTERFHQQPGALLHLRTRFVLLDESLSSWSLRCGYAVVHHHPAVPHRKVRRRSQH